MDVGDSTAPGKKLIFGRFGREECGLPPTNWGRTNRLAMLSRGAALLALLVLAGWLAGVLVGRWRESWVATLPSRVRAAAPEDIPALLGKGRMYAISQPGRVGLNANLAFAAMVAAEQSPRRMGYYGNAARLLGSLEREMTSSPEEMYTVSLMAAEAYGETGDYPQAFASLARANEALEKMPDSADQRRRRLLLVNAQAYYLATAPVHAGRNPERALHLAQLMMTSKDKLPGDESASAPFFDTLASAWHAVGDSERALAAQTFALGLAKQSGLDVYIRHYDEYKKQAVADREK